MKLQVFLTDRPNGEPLYSKRRFKPCCVTEKKNNNVKHSNMQTHPTTATVYRHGRHSDSSKKLAAKKSSRTAPKKSRWKPPKKSRKTSRKKSPKKSRKKSPKKSRKKSPKKSRKKSGDRQYTKKYTDRPGPPFAANTPTTAGKYRMGNDGKLYQSLPNSRGVYRWVKARQSTLAERWALEGNP